MTRLLAAIGGLTLATMASAHFVYLVPAGGKVHVIFSDSLEADENVSIDKIAATKLFAVYREGKQVPLEWTKGKAALLAVLPDRDVYMIGGDTDYGFHQSKHTQNKPVRLKYYPKVILGDVASAEKLRLGAATPLEIIPSIRDGKLHFQALLRGKPLPKAEFGLLIPGEGKGQKLTGDGEGRIPTSFTSPGKYAARVAYIEPTAGEVGGKKYEEIRHYATLVVEYAP